MNVFMMFHFSVVCFVTPIPRPIPVRPLICFFLILFYSDVRICPLLYAHRWTDDIAYSSSFIKYCVAAWNVINEIAMYDDGILFSFKTGFSLKPNEKIRNFSLTNW